MCHRLKLIIHERFPFNKLPIFTPSHPAAGFSSARGRHPTLKFPSHFLTDECILGKKNFRVEAALASLNRAPTIWLQFFMHCIKFRRKRLQAQPQHLAKCKCTKNLYENANSKLIVMPAIRW